MRPMMRNTIAYKATNGSVEYDEFGRPIATQQTTRARIRETSKVSGSSNEFVTAWYYEIDVLPNVQLQRGDVVEFKDPSTLEKKTGQVESGSTGLNIAGNRIEYRTYIVQTR